MIEYVCDDFIVAFKPHNIPTVPLKTQDIVGTFLGLVSEKYPEVLDVYGKNSWEGSVLHRLDTATEGLVVFARNQRTYDYLADLQANNKMKKVYKATCSNKSDSAFTDRKIESYFRAFGPKGKLVKAEENIQHSDNGILYSTEIHKVHETKESITFECTITKGFRHQIRVHLAYVGYPIIGDSLYNPYKKEGDLMLSCIQISFKKQDGSDFTFRTAR